MEWIDSKTVFIIFHLIGVTLGAGGAYISDMMFFSSVKDKRITDTEIRFLRLGSRAVWIGLTILFISGAFLFMTNPEGYMTSTKFLSKMTIVVLITINGVIFHIAHMPIIEKFKNVNLITSDEFAKKKKFLISSGAISLISWTWALSLGAIKSIPYSYTLIISVYLVTIFFGILFANFIFKKSI
jgi:hypothetical protein